MMDREKLGLNPIKQSSVAQSANPSSSSTGVVGNSQFNADALMKSSTGFGSSQTKMRMSGSGFRPSSRGKEPSASGPTYQGYKLNLINLSQDQLTFASQIKADLIQLQEEINLLDIDGKLRSGNTIEFNQSHISVMKKWLAGTSEKDVKKDIETRALGSVDSDRLLESLGVKTPEEGMKKLFKQVSVLEVMVNQLTEYEILFYLRFEDTFSSLMNKFGTSSSSSTSSSSKSTLLASGVHLNRFHVCFANLQRFRDLIGASRKLIDGVSEERLTPSTSSSITLGNKKTLPEVPTKENINPLAKINFSNSKSKDQLIKKLKSDPILEDLRAAVQQFFDQAAKNEETLQLQLANFAKSSSSVSYNGSSGIPVAQFQEVKNKFQQEKTNFQQQIDLLNEEIANMKSDIQMKNEELTSSKKESEQKSDDINQLRRDLEKQSDDLKKLETAGQPIFATLPPNSATTSTAASKPASDSTTSGTVNRHIQSKSMHSMLPPSYQDDPQYWVQLMDEVKDSFERRITILENDNMQFQDLYNTEKVKHESLRDQIVALQEELAELKKIQNQIYDKFRGNFMKKEDFQDTYQCALKDEFDRMKAAFEKRIDTLMFEVQQQKKDQIQTLAEMQIQLDQETETQNLLLKQLSAFIQ